MQTERHDGLSAQLHCTVVDVKGPQIEITSFHQPTFLIGKEVNVWTNVTLMSVFDVPLPALQQTDGLSQNVVQIS
jgi:hypothetical protein